MMIKVHWKMPAALAASVLIFALALTGCRSPVDSGQAPATTGTVTGRAVFVDGANGAVTIELKLGYGDVYAYIVVTPSAGEVRFEVTPGTYYLYATAGGSRERLHYGISVQAGGVYTLGDINITINVDCDCGTATCCTCIPSTGCDCTPGTVIEIRNGYWYIGGINTGIAAQGTPGTPGAPGTVIEIRNGYWYIDGENTGIAVQGAPGIPGAPGAPGTVIEIRDGYWYIDGENTGVAVQGPAGAPGSVISICPDTGYWLIDGVCTGVPAQGPAGTPGSVISICPDTGYWLIDGICTGVPAQGPAGTPGVAPTINNGYWYVGDVNTGIPVTGPQGPAGTPGSVVSICPDTGNWLIDGVCTGVPAQGPAGTPGSVISICPDTSNWLIDGVCTGVPVQGPAGTPGVAPTISNGYWYVGGVNTGIPVTGPQGPAGTPGSVVSICPDTGNWLIDGVCTGVPTQAPPSPQVETIAVNQNGAGIDSLEIPMNEYAILTATFAPTGATAPVIWTSDSRYMVVTPMAAPRFSMAVGESVMVRAVGPVADATITAMAVVSGASVFASVFATSGSAAHITIDFVELGNEAPEISAKPFSMLDGYSIITLSQADFGRFYTIRWIFDGADIERPFDQAELGTHTMVSYGGGTLALGPHINGRRLGVGNHFLTLMATTEDGVPFSRRITFTVTR